MKTKILHWLFLAVLSSSVFTSLRSECMADLKKRTWNFTVSEFVTVAASPINVTKNQLQTVSKSLGTYSYRLVTGAVPFSGQSNRELTEPKKTFKSGLAYIEETIIPNPVSSDEHNIPAPCEDNKSPKPSEELKSPVCSKPPLCPKEETPKSTHQKISKSSIR